MAVSSILSMIVVIIYNMADAKLSYNTQKDIFFFENVLLHM